MTDKTNANANANAKDIHRGAVPPLPIVLEEFIDNNCLPYRQYGDVSMSITDVRYLVNLALYNHSYAAMRPNRAPGQGEKDQRCNRYSCQKTGAWHQHIHNLKYYCDSCAHEINKRSEEIDGITLFPRLAKILEPQPFTEPLQNYLDRHTFPYNGNDPIEGAQVMNRADIEQLLRSLPHTTFHEGTFKSKREKKEPE